MESKAIVIVGAGAFGLSTALRLAQAGYTNITVLDKSSEVPSEFSAANDVNKILRAEYEDDFYTQLTKEAFDAWKSPLFAPHFRRTGFLHCVSVEAPQRAVDTLERFRAAAERDPELRRHVVPIERGARDIADHAAWQYRDSPLPGWRGYLNRYDGYAHSTNALRAAFRAAAGLGVRFVLGAAGAAEEIVYGGPGGAATGVRTSSSIGGGGGGGGGEQQQQKKTTAKGFVAADLVVVAAGAASARLVPQAGRTLVAKSWSVAHVRLTDDEAAALRGIPVTYAREFGFLFEPEPGTNLLKICPMGGGYVNTDPATGESHPPATAAESRFMPEEDQTRCRKLLQHALPHLAGRPLINQTLCWFADTSDSDFVVDYVPGSRSSVVLLSGDSGHGFKMFPIVGRWVEALLAAPDGRQPVERWRWREPPPPSSREGGGGGKDWGDSVSWRLGNTVEFDTVRPAPKAKL